MQICVGAYLIFVGFTSVIVWKHCHFEQKLEL